MTSSKEVERLSPELSSSPPRPIEESEYTGTSSAETSPTLTLGHSSPELPPLPALPTLSSLSQTHPVLPSTSENSSSYYTASWGSPYQNPPAESIAESLAAHRRSVTTSSEVDEDSPNPRFGLSHLLPTRLPTVFPLSPTRPSTPSPESPPSSPTRFSYFANPARSIKQLFSPQRTPGESAQRPPAPSWNLRRGSIWNSEGEKREVELQASPPQRNVGGRERNIEPFLLDGIADTAARTDRLRDKGHRSRDSNLTLTQEDFWPTFKFQETTSPSTMFSSRYASVPPPPPTKDTELTQSMAKSPSPQLPTPSTMEGISPHLSFQRNDSTASTSASIPGRIRKKVLYKGKNVQICIPQELPRGTPGNPPLPLSADAVKARMQQFESAGYDTRGFGHWRGADLDPFLLDDRAQNRGIYPDPAEDMEARTQRKFNVSVPDRRQWQAYVDFLREEKLRALGVGLGGESDGGTAMSRQSSSQFSASLPFSPPLPTSSAGSHRHGHHQSVFLTGFVPGSSNHTSTRSIASPISSMGNARHMHRQSMFTSPPNFSQQSMSPTGFAAWSPQQLLSPTGMAPGGSPALQDLNNRRSPVSPFVQQHEGHQFPFSQRDDLLAQMQRQKQQQVQIQQQQIQQMLSARPASTLQEVPEAESEEESVSKKVPIPRADTPEIVNPKPSHRHNISVKLEMDIQNSDYHLEESIDRQLDEDDTLVSGKPAKASVNPLQLPQRTTSLNAANSSTKLADIVKLSSKISPTLSAVSDVETNPSEAEKIEKTAANRKAADSTDSAANPWANDKTFQQRDPSPPKPELQRHRSSMCSISKLNVTAKEFSPSGNPSASFNPAIFGSSSFAFQPAKAKSFVPTSAGAFAPPDRASRHSSKASASGLSAAAPVFSPNPSAFGSTFGSPTFGVAFNSFSPPNSEFSFISGGPAFRPTAPVFQPQSPGVFSDNSGTSTSDRPGKIFSNINLNDVIVPGKKSKALPILRPSVTTESNEEHEDEEGRIARGTDRMKRARRTGSNGDQVPQFASPTPEATKAIADPAVVEPELPKPTEDKVEEIPQIESVERIIEPTLEDVRVQVSPEKIDDVEEVSEFVDDSELPLQNSADSTLAVAEPDAEPAASPISPVSSVDEDSHKMEERRQETAARVFSNASTLSASAPPFELKPIFAIDPELRNLVATRLQTTPKKESLPMRSVISPASDASKTEIDHSSDPLEVGGVLDGETPPRERLPSSVRYYDDLDQPSFQEIDAIMQHFNEEGSDAGIEREEEPSWPNSSHQESVSPRPMSPEVPDFPAKIRSDAPSPSPRRSLFSRPLNLPDVDSASITQDPFSDGRAAPPYDSPIHRLNDTGDVPISDWDDAISSTEDNRLRERSSFFDSRVSEVIGAAVDNRLAPLEKRFQEIIQEQLAQFQPPAPSRRVRSRATVDSDADDEDDDLETDAYSRGWSPKRDRKMDKFRVMLQDALATHYRSTSPTPVGASEFSALRLAVDEVKASVAQSMNELPNLDHFKDVVDETVSRQNERLIQNREEAVAREATDRFSDFTERWKEIAAQLVQETEARREAERQEKHSRQRLELAEEELALLKESLQDANSRVVAMEAATRHAQDDAAEVDDTRARLSKKLMAVTSENEALKETLEEYRISSSKWRHDIEQANAEKERIHVSFGALKIQAEEALRIRETMRSRIEKLQDGVNAAAGQIAHERSKWARSDTEHRTRYEVLSARIEAEGRTRERLEQELERLETQEMEAMRLRIMLEQSQKEVAHLRSECERLDMQGREIPSLKFELVQMQKENSRLEELVDNLRSESAEQQKLADQYAREFREAREAGRIEVQRTRGLMEIDIEAANNHVNAVRVDLESETARIRAELESVKMDADTAKAKHELELEQEADARRDALREAADSRHGALQELREAYEERMEELRKQHRRDLDHNIENKNQSETFLREAHAHRLGELEEHHGKALEHALADKQHLETMHNDRLTLADSKIDHLQDKVLHLEEKLEIAKSAAQAAVMAAQSAKSPTFTAAPAVARVPEKISTQALRETIGVLQEQLQERELRLESLEQELSEVDKDAPNKIRERDTEIGWLRELLGVRLDDLQDLVNALALPTYDRGAVRNAAIRIRTSIQMEQQEKERQLSGQQAMPTLASISNFASPKAAQLAAAIGKWRKGGTMAPSGLSQSFSNLTGTSTSGASSRTQTPSKPASAAQSFLNGLMTPPASNVRKTPSPDASMTSGPSIGRPLSSLSGETRGRPLRSQEKMPIGRDDGDSPSTPPLLGLASYDEDAEESTNGYYDDDESTIEGTPRAERLRRFEPLSLRDD